MASEYCKFPHCECSMGAAERCKRIRTRRAPVDANPLTSNSVDDKIVPDTNSNAPTATDTGLVTLSVELTPSGRPYMKSDPEGDYVLLSQAEELLAAEIRRERDLAEKQLSEVVDRMSDDYLALKAELDQAVGVIEDRSSEYEALEAKLTAAEKALKSARPYVEDYDTRRHNTGVDETLTQIDAALGGKPL